MYSEPWWPKNQIYLVLWPKLFYDKKLIKNENTICPLLCIQKIFFDKSIKKQKQQTGNVKIKDIY